METSLDVVSREVLDVVPEIMRTIRMEMRSRRGAYLSVVQFRALIFIDRKPGTSLSAVADYLGLTLPTVSAMIDGMVANAVVTRGDSPADRRRVELTLSPQGEDLLETARGGTLARLAEILAGLEPKERESVHQVMRRLQSLFSLEILDQGVPA